MENKLIKNKGITLIALVITIIILLILAAVAIGIFSNNNILERAKEASFKTKMSEISEELEFYNTALTMQNESTNYYAGEILKEIIQSEELEIENSSVMDISKILKEVGKKEKEYVMIYEGNLYYVSQPKISNNANQVKWCNDLGIRIWEYVPNSGIKVVNGNYELVNGVYLCTPQLNAGWSKDNTRYVKLKGDNLVPGKWINKKPDDDWYDYKNNNWANIYVETSGIESYYVWIPRYVYKVDSENSVAGNERMDVKFVDAENNYIDAETEEKLTWEELQAQGYQLPEAFTFDEQDLPGYWMSKYQLSDLTTYTIDFSTTATVSSITIKDIKTNASEEIAKYTYAINGTIVHESTTPEEYTVKNLAKGNKAVNVTALNANGEIIGSMTRKYETADVNEPDVSSFDKETTFYVYWDENGKEHNEIPISKEAPKEWYDYTTANWANIVTRNDGLETYYVWIPRYQYMLDNTSQRSYVKFIKGIGTETDSGYKIPEAFTFDGQELTGYWITKYQLTQEESEQRINAEMAAGSNLIRIRDITGTAIDEAKTNGVNVKYEYYINGDKKHEGTDSAENYVFEGLTANTTYGVNIIARNKDTDEFIAAVTKKISTIDANTPDVSSFNQDTTYYVYYEGDEEKRVSIKEKAPAKWYDYSNQNWANIVTTANNTETYFVWIPRYEYKILSDRTNLSTANRRIDVTFIPTSVTNSNCSKGYKVPEAFTFDGQELAGYWISKYQLGN